MENDNQPKTDKKVSVTLVFGMILLAIGLLFVGAFGFWIMQSKMQMSASPTPSPMATISPKTSSLPATSSALPEVSPVSENETISDSDQIRQALADRHSKALSETEATINEFDGSYAKGLVRFAGEIGGGWFLAYNDGTSWLIVADGNGTVICADIEPYDFPVSMVPECWDEGSATLQTR
ncbi:hypothetical protein ACFLZ1_01990 [Patescibacteria group bacterium]